MNLLSNERGFVAGWAVKLILFLALLGIVIYDGAAIAVNAFQLDTVSDEVALEVSSSARDKSLFTLEREAKKAARARDARLVEIKLNADKSVLRVTIRREAPTLVVSRFSRISEWGHLSATGKVSTD
jgi:ribosome maturation factor RimP